MQVLLLSGCPLHQIHCCLLEMTDQEGPLSDSICRELIQVHEYVNAERIYFQSSHESGRSAVLSFSSFVEEAISTIKDSFLISLFVCFFLRQ